MISKTTILLSLALCVLGDGHHAVSEQHIKIHHKEHHGHHGEMTHIGSKEPEHHEEYAWSYPSYEFSYSVHDPNTHDKKGQHESRDGDEVKGEYWLIEPDGRKRTVTYHADKHSGFHAIVHYSDDHHHIDKHHGYGKEEHGDKKGDSGEKGRGGDEGRSGEERHEENDSSNDKGSEEESGDEGRKGEESRGHEGHIEKWGYGPKWDHGKYDSPRGDEGRDHEESVLLEQRRRFDEQRGYKSHNTAYFGYASRINPRFYRQKQHRSASRY